MLAGGLSRRTVVLGVALTVVALAVSVLLRHDERGAGSTLKSLSTRAAAATPTTPAATGDTQGVPADPGTQIASLLAQRGSSVMSKNRDAWLRTIASSASSFRTDQNQVFGRLIALTPNAWHYDFRRAAALPLKQGHAAGGWIAEVDLVYRLTSDGPTTYRRQYLTIVPSGSSASTAAASAAAPGLGNWRIAGNTGGPTQPDLWDLSPIAVTRASRCIVVGSTKWRGLSQRIARTCTASAQRVDAAWGSGLPARTVLVVPDSQKELARLLDRSGSAAKGLEQTAAVTVGPTDSAEEVLINPAVFRQFPVLGIRVVLAHELVHVATRATGSGNAPTWLAEGFADYVGFGDSGLSSRGIAGEALQQVDRGHLPTALPPDSDFDSARQGAATAYGFAWTIVKTIAQHGGSKRVVDFYRAAAAGPGTGAVRVDLAVRKVLHLKNTGALVTQWRRELKVLAR